jgi:N-acyl-D-amino-acid deacylase
MAENTHGIQTLAIDIGGLAVAPGSINMMSHTQERMLVAGRAQRNIYQSITLMGEGRSMGPLNDSVMEDLRARGDEIPYEFAWLRSGSICRSPEPMPRRELNDRSSYRCHRTLQRR